MTRRAAILSFALFLVPTQAYPNHHAEDDDHEEVHLPKPVSHSLGLVDKLAGVKSLFCPSTGDDAGGDGPCAFRCFWDCSLASEADCLAECFKKAIAAPTASVKELVETCMNKGAINETLDCLTKGKRSVEANNKVSVGSRVNSAGQRNVKSVISTLAASTLVLVL